MSDTAEAPAAPAVTGQDANANAATNGSQAAAASDWLSGLRDEGNRQYVETKGWKELDPLVASARHADKLASEIADLKSKTLTPPAPEAEAKEWDAFYAKLGRPEKPDGYEFKLPEGLPENLPYDAEKAAQYKQWSHQAGLTPKQAQIVHDLAAKAAVADFTKAQEALVARGEAAHGEIVKAWGAKGSDAYVQNVQFADRFIKNNGGEALLTELKANGLLSSEGVVLSPRLAQAMAAAGKALYAEDQVLSGGKVPAARDLATTLYPTDPFYPNGR